MTIKEMLVEAREELERAKSEGRKTVAISRATLACLLFAVSLKSAKMPRHNYDVGYICPNCNESVKYGNNYCCNCGEWLSWGDN